MSRRPGSSDPAVIRMVEKQMRNWELAKAQRISLPEPQRPEVEDFVSISRSVAAGGKDVALKLGDALGWPVFDRGILQVMAGDNDIRRKIYASMDERDLGWCEESLRSLMQPEFVKNDYFHRLTQTVLSIARQGHAVFLGRGTDLILPRHIGFRVRLVAPREVCIKNFAGRHVVSIKHAREDIARIEKERAEFIRHHFRTTPDDPLRYDLIISTAMFSPDQAVDVILDARKRAGIGQ